MALQTDIQTDGRLARQMDEGGGGDHSVMGIKMDLFIIQTSK